MTLGGELKVDRDFANGTNSESHARKTMTWRVLDSHQTLLESLVVECQS
jgi:hypothetical protein